MNTKAETGVIGYYPRIASNPRSWMKQEQPSPEPLGAAIRGAPRSPDTVVSDL